MVRGDVMRRHTEKQNTANRRRQRYAHGSRPSVYVCRRPGNSVQPKRGIGTSLTRLASQIRTSLKAEHARGVAGVDPVAIRRGQLQRVDDFARPLVSHVEAVVAPQHHPVDADQVD